MGGRRHIRRGDVGLVGRRQVPWRAAVAAAGKSRAADCPKTPSAETEALGAISGPPARFKVGKADSYRFECLTACQVTRKLPRVLQRAEPRVTPSTPARSRLVRLPRRSEAQLSLRRTANQGAHPGRLKLVTSSQTQWTTGATDTETRNFRFQS